ncbi:MAG: alpha/beta hydrolase [Bryobacteraceae bacterium]|nr:alpha/beta hydrolase [Bryobacteraceae bacterium]
MFTLLLFLGQALPGTALLQPVPDPAARMLDGLHSYADARLRSAPARRDGKPPSREKLRELIGAIDERVPPAGFIPHGDGVQWPVVDGVVATGRWIEAQGTPACYQVALSADLQGKPGCATLLTGLLENSPAVANQPRLGKQTEQPPREFLYRMAYPMGRHPLGYEVQTVLAAVDNLALRSPKRPLRLVALGGHNSLVALLACALDPRIDECAIANLDLDLSDLSRLPVQYNVWQWAEYFSRDRLAAMIAPRKLTLNTVIPGVAIVIPASQPPLIRQWIDYTQRLIRETTWQRPAWFAGQAREQARQALAGVFGEFPDALAPVRAETRLRYQEKTYTGYEVRLPVSGPVEAYGHLLLPAGLKPGEKRALVVTQHGLEGRPEDTILPEKTRVVYDEFARKLVEQGYIVYSPQNPYILGERFRNLQRKANPLGLSLFSFIRAQHRQALNWLETLPFVDAQRIGYYGLSYGGVTALRVPPLEPRYRVVVCSGNFNEWLWKLTSIEDSFSFMFTKEYEAFDWNLGPRFGHAEMAALIAPRPFLVERGHSDGVGIDEWVAYEFAKAKRYYAQAGVPELAEITYFDGPHRIHGDYAYGFIRKHLGEPVTKAF